jgi:hypothetical protein
MNAVIICCLVLPQGRRSVRLLCAMMLGEDGSAHVLVWRTELSREGCRTRVPAQTFGAAIESLQAPKLKSTNLSITWRPIKVKSFGQSVRRNALCEARALQEEKAASSLVSLNAWQQTLIRSFVHQQPPAPSSASRRRHIR